MLNKKEERARYERIYGATCPLPYGTDGECSRVIKSSYNGCRIESERITFSFSPLSVLDDEFHRIEMVFRNRLGRKISFQSSYDYFSVWVNPSDFEEAGQYLTAAFILDNYYRGREQSAYQKAENIAFKKGFYWRRASIVKPILEEGLK